jgi:hypothetical protein
MSGWAMAFDGRWAVYGRPQELAWVGSHATCVAHFQARHIARHQDMPGHA